MLLILTRLGFVTRELLLTPLQFGVPNSRLRYYLLATARPAGAFSEDSERILRHIPGYPADWDDAKSSAAAPETVENKVRSVRDYLDRKDTQTAYAVPERVLIKWGRLFDIVLPSATRTCCFIRGLSTWLTNLHWQLTLGTGYTQLVERAGSILQENEELDVSVRNGSRMFSF